MSRIVSSFLPATLAYYYNKYENYIMLIVLALLCMNILDGVIGFLCSGVLKGIEWLVELIPFFESPLYCCLLYHLLLTKLVL